MDGRVRLRGEDTSARRNVDDVTGLAKHRLQEMAGGLLSQGFCHRVLVLR
jgi:hypothetical protein